MMQDTNRLNQTGNSIDDLSNLGPGCYVKILDGDKSYWTEIIRIEGGRITGIVHPELTDRTMCNDCPSMESAVRFNKEHIVDLGCDNYCWC